MVRASLAELLEALGAVLVVVGLIFWSLPVALSTAGLFLLVVANAPPAASMAQRSARSGRREAP